MGFRCECALLVAQAKMCIQEVSSRKEKAVTKKLCRVAMSSTQLSHVAALFDPKLEK